MKTKQIIGIVVAGLTFIIVCVSSMAANKFIGTSVQKSFTETLKEMEKSDVELPEDDYVGIVRVEGTMQDTGSSSSIFGTEGYDHQGLLEQVENFMDDDENKGILLYVNSPGGTVNAADELYLKLMEYKKETSRPIYVYMADEACSGGYYVSVAGDKIYANRNTWTGSIGVYIQLSNLKGLYDKLGIKTNFIKAGKNKTMGSDSQELTEEQEAIFQSLVDEAYEQFVDVIVAGRTKLTEQQIRTAADGRIYTSAQAKQVGLIDDIKTYDEVVELVEKELGEDIEIYDSSEEDDSFWSFLNSKLNILTDKKEKTETEQLLELAKKYGSGVPMYYAMH